MVALRKPPARKPFPSFEEWQAQRMGVGNPSGQPLSYEQWLFQRGGGPAPQQQAPQEKSPTDIIKDEVTKRGEKYLTDQAENVLFGETATPATQSAWNAPGGAASQAAWNAPGLASGASSAALVPSVSGGVATIPAGAAIPAGWTGIGSAAGGGTLVVPAAGGSAGASGVQGAGAAGGTSALATGLGAAGALYGGYQLYNNWGTGGTAGRKQGAVNGATAGAGVGTMILPGVGTAVGAGIGALGGLALGSIKTGKHKDQLLRDSVRSTLKEKKVIGDDYKLKFSDGSAFDMGLDGGYRDADGRRQFELGFDNPAEYQGRLIADLAPLGAIIGGGNKKAANDTVGYFTKASMAGAKDETQARARASEIYAKTGMTYEEVMNGIAELEKMDPAKGGIDKQLADIYRHSTDIMLGGQKQPMMPTAPKIPVATPGPVSTLSKIPGAIQPLNPAIVSNPGSSWVGPDGKPVTGPGAIDPGRFVGNKVIAPIAPLPPQVMIPGRSKTSSPGVGLDGRPIPLSSYARR